MRRGDTACGRLARVRRPPLAFVIVSLLALPGFDWPGRADHLAAALHHASPERRRDAVREAATSPDAEARRVLIAALDDTDLGVRRSAAEAVSRARITEAAPALTRWLDDPNPELRLTATRALGALRASTSLGALTRMLADADVEVRKAAVRAVTSVGGAGAAVALLDRLSDLDASVRVETARALGELGDRRAVFSLLGALQDTSVEVRVASAASLGRIRDPRAQRGLVTLIHDQAFEARSAAVSALGAIGRDVPDVVADLAVVALRESREGEAAAQSRLALEAVHALARIATPAACDVLVDVVRRGSDGIDRTPVYAAMQALQSTGAQGAARVTTLVAVTPPEFTDTMVDTLGGIGGDDAARALLALLDRPDLSTPTRSRAWTALGRTGSSLALLPLISQAERGAVGVRGPLARACPRPRLNPPALVGLLLLANNAGTLGPDALDLLSSLLERAGDGCAAQSAQVVTLLGRTGNARAPGRLRPLLASPSQQVRRAAIDALRRAGVEGAERDLAALISDPSPDVRLAASDALSAHGGPAAITAVLDRWNGDQALDRTSAARVLGRSLRGADRPLVEGVVRALSRCAHDASSAVSAACTDALADAAATGSTDALEALVAALDLRDETRALPALEALANAAATGDDAVRARVRAAVDTVFAASPLATDRARLAASLIVGDDRLALDALASGDAAIAANALAATRHARGALSLDLARALWASLSTRLEEALLVNASLALAARFAGEVDFEALSALLRHPSSRVRRAAATLLRAIPDASLEGALRGRRDAEVERCASDRSSEVRAVCDAQHSAEAASEVRSVDARVVDGTGVARAFTGYAIVLPGGWIRLGTTGPDGWIHERASTAGTFRVMGRDELSDGAW